MRNICSERACNKKTQRQNTPDSHRKILRRRDSVRKGFKERMWREFFLGASRKDSDIEIVKSTAKPRDASRKKGSSLSAPALAKRRAVLANLETQLNRMAKECPPIDTLAVLNDLRS